MAITDLSLTSEIQSHLLEPVNNGASYNSGLYTTTEVASRLNFRANLFNMLTNIYVIQHEQAAVNNSKNQDLSTTFADLIDILDVNYSSTGTRAGGGTYYSISPGSSFEADNFIAIQSAQTLPSLYAIDSAIPLQINMFPPPTFSASNGQLLIFYIPKLGSLPDPPNGSSFTGIPDDFTPFIKYGALADLFLKSGEAYDPLRGSICDGLFNLGVELARSWISGTTAEPVSAQQPFVAPING